jgi:hypothetical protein
MLRLSKPKTTGSKLPFRSGAETYVSVAPKVETLITIPALFVRVNSLTVLPPVSPHISSIIEFVRSAAPPQVVISRSVMTKERAVLFIMIFSFSQGYSFSYHEITRLMTVNSLNHKQSNRREIGIAGRNRLIKEKAPPWGGSFFH